LSFLCREFPVNSADKASGAMMAALMVFAVSDNIHPFTRGGKSCRHAELKEP
jgi:hypothetical protein